MANRDLALSAITVLASIGALICTLEWLANSRQLKSDGLFSWDVMSSRPLTTGRGIHRWLNRALSYRPFIAILYLRMAVLVGLPFALWSGRFELPMLAIAFATTLLINARFVFGLDGSDQMTTQIFGALFIGFAVGSDVGLDIALWYIAVQSCLAYFTSGFAKVASPHWRRGDSVFGIFNTRTYGFEPVARFLSNKPRLTRLLDWSAFTVELAFPISLLVGFPMVLVFVAWGVAFHLMNAFVMGLNGFLWSFVATYPAVVFCSIAVEAVGN